MIQRTSVRSIFVSDVHLGCRFAGADAFLQFLRSYDAEHIYIVGDFFDGWKLRRRWYREPVYNQILRRLIQMVQFGSRIYYAPGNHDAFLRAFPCDLDGIEIADEFVHELAGRRRFLVIHGDQFDKVELCAQWLSVLGGWAYEALLHLNRGLNSLRRLVGWADRHYTGRLKQRVKRAINFISDFERLLIDYATQSGCDGVVCGHIHTPMVTQVDGMIYCNSGDWVENRCALLEHQSGMLEIVQSDPAGGLVSKSVLHPLPAAASREHRSQRQPERRLAETAAAV